MTGLIPILLLGTLVLVFGARLLLKSWRNKDAPVVTIEDFSRARAELDSVFVETAAIRRIFASDDFEFVSRRCPCNVQHFFLRERKALAVQWLRMTQSQVAHLMDLHLRLASYTYDPSPRLELKLNFKYVWFILTTRILLIVLSLRGPFEAVRIVSYTLRATEYFCSLCSLRLEKIDPAKLGSI